MMLKITGYSDKISTKPGEALHFYINCTEPNYQAQLVRLRCGDMNPEGPGFKEEYIHSAINREYPGRKQEINAGSFGVVKINKEAFGMLQKATGNFSVETFIYPTLIKDSDQYIIDYYDESGFSLLINSEGKLEAVVGEALSVKKIQTSKPLSTHVWYHVALSVTEEMATLELTAFDLYHNYLAETVAIECSNINILPKTCRPLLFAGKLSKDKDSCITATNIFNGKIENPVLSVSVQDEENKGKQIKNSLIAQWDFSKEIPSTKIVDTGPLGLHGGLVNLPTRGVTSHTYTGEVTSWVQNPEHYSAIHFHDDDLYDAKWEIDFTLTIPESIKSGIYAVKLTAADQDEYIPFVIGAGKKKNKAALLFPTATYMAYANEHITMDPPIGELICQRAMQFAPYQLFLNEHREYGNSLYDVHSDGSGVHYSSRLRPILNMRPKRFFSIGAGSSFLWQFNADTHITDWLEENEFEYDVVTDEELEYDGVSALADYQVILTTTHPEYYSLNMLKALEGFLGTGGRLMYMGGNGFYWRVAFHQELPGVIEVRRITGTRAWEIAPGESFHSFTGEVGGLWRHNNRSPNKLCGVGFAAQGFDRSSYFRRQIGADNPRAEFVFHDVEDDILGNFGLIGGGAAGMEIDRFDTHLGSPRHALVLASSEHHSAAHLVAVEDIFNNYLGTDGEQNSLVRADVTFFETPSGGAVFSTGSIAWSGALSHNNYKNNISQITKNVLCRFINPEPFNYPLENLDEEKFFDEENPPQQIGS